MADVIIDILAPDDLSVVVQLYNQIFRPPIDQRFDGRRCIIDFQAANLFHAPKQKETVNLAAKNAGLHRVARVLASRKVFGALGQFPHLLHQLDPPAEAHPNQHTLDARMGL